ncbi:hypothetical protein ACHAWF_002615 [Thalassiosira exigua]
MALTTAQKNKRKRERKKRERAEERERLEREKVSAEEEEARQRAKRARLDPDADAAADVEVEYVAEPLSLPDIAASDGDAKKDGSGAAAKDGDGGAGEGGGDDDLRAIVRRFQDRAAVAYVTDDEPNGDAEKAGDGSNQKKGDECDGDGAEGDEDEPAALSKRKLKDLLRPTVAELKQKVSRPELVEAHDVAAPDPDFLVYLKGVPGTVPVPRHWGRKRKYLQGKRGVEKPPFGLPDFIVKTGICDVRDATAEDEAKMSVRQKNRMRVSGRAGGVDVDYRTLHDAFFKHQTKPEKMTEFGDLYYEGKEYETARSSNYRPGHMSERLREALGMPNEYSPPPWLINTQRYGPPPSYPNARIPGLNAPLPAGASYGYHVGGWGKPPVDQFGRPLYGGDPFGKPETAGGGEEDPGAEEDLYGLTSASTTRGGLITSDGKALGKKPWGALPGAFQDDEEEEESSEEESSEEESEEEMEESEEEEGEVEPPATTGEEAVAVPRAPGMDSVLPDGVDSVVPSGAVDLRKPGDETPMVEGGPPKQLYTVLQQTAAEGDNKAVFASDHAYVLPGAGPGSGMPEGAASVLSKATSAGGTIAGGRGARKQQDEEDEAEELGKKFKF